MVTAKLISAFVFATQIVQFLYFLNLKFQASSHLLWQYSPVCVGPGRKPRRPVFSERGSYVGPDGNSEDRFSHEAAQNRMCAIFFWQPFMDNLQGQGAKPLFQNSQDFHYMSLVVRKPLFGFPTRSHTNQAVQRQKMAGGLKFRI